MPTHAEVTAMKRPELQALCKSIGQRANGKTEALLRAIIEHYELDENPTAPSAPAPSHKPPKAKKSAGPIASASMQTKGKPSVPTAPSSSFEEDEEDELQLGVGAPAPKKAAGKKAVTSGSGSSASGSGTAPTPASHQDVRAHSTNIVTTLLSTVQTLQSELASARTALAKLEGIVSALPAPLPPSPALSEADVLSLVDGKISTLRSEITAALDERVKGVERRVEEVRAEIPAPRDVAEEEIIKELAGKLNAQMESTDQWKAEVEVAINSLRSEVFRAPIPQAQPAAIPVPPTQIPTLASPSPSEDAPPIETLGSFSSPPTPATGSPAPIATPSSLTHRSPRKLPSTSNNPVLASALPLHMLAGASPSLRSPRGRARSSTIIATPQPQSPARPVIATPNLGKHARGSDASELSFAVDVVEKEEARCPEKSDGHSRKRMRVSAAGSVEEEQVEAQVVEQQQQQDSSFASTEGDESLEEATSQLVEKSLVQERDFVVQTKTGSPARPSTSDPSFFASLPARSPGPGPSSARKSLPMGALPFPLVSPFARKSLGFASTPASAVRQTSLFGDATNAVAPTPPAARTLYGSERESSVSFADDDADVEEMEGEGARFEDVSLEMSPRKPQWGVGMFGRV